ncbi:hypothetical protein C2S53_005721 [Perilla frutescens var. hirtella]|uniref:EF-hand domain-containing protein n=1 Tax=Perilla frutescens var. hirtella TaxID=608512 RepID=A0AAD4JFW2_PERFH|nr:hypothetical protein C2S51_010111 [Perilla frutescens var. frutescens]KAH6833083.1 hypothetical protein C2S53_005721 [Perilla frutescens var. hirtella]
MEVVRAIADAHYRAGSDAVKSLAYEFFRALDTDGDGRVSLHEFLVLMNQEGHTRLANPYFYRVLDRDGNGFLDFWEVLTLYYIIKSGRPICQCCGILVIDTFFSCVECFNSSEGSHSLCIHCYRAKRSHHNHNGRQQFLDTFTLLQTKKRPTPEHHNIQGRPWEWPPSAQPSWSSITPQGQGSTAIVPTTRMSRWKAALEALEVGLAIGNISSTLCTIL